MKQKSFGLDIGAQNMKVVWLATSNKGFLLNGAGMMKTPQKGMFSESPLDQEEVAQAIRTLVSEAKITTKYVSISLPENQVYTRVIDMPMLSDKELVSAIYYEAEQYIPVPLTSITLDYKVLSKPESTQAGGKMQVLLVGAPTVLIDRYEKVLSLCGLVITSIETELLSVIRSCIIGDVVPPTLVANIGATSTSLAIVKNNVITFTYSIPTGGVAISRAIAASFGFSLEQAEEYKRVYGFSDKTLGGKITQSVQPVVTLLSSEMKKALAFYSGKYPGEPLKQIVLAGGTSKLPGFTAYIAQQTGIESLIANPWKVLADQEVSKDIIDNAPDFAIAVGLAMR